jgi:arsenate reductase (thioredoxin)
MPDFPGITERNYWPFPDPSTFTGSDEEIMAKVREVRDAIRERVLIFVEESRSKVQSED